MVFFGRGPPCHKKKRLPPGLQPRMDGNQVRAGAKWVLQPVRPGEWWIVVDRKSALLATAIDKQSACRHPKGCAWGGRLEEASKED